MEMIQIDAVTANIVEKTDYQGDLTGRFALTVIVESNSRWFLEQVQQAVCQALSNPEPNTKQAPGKEFPL